MPGGFRLITGRKAKLPAGSRISPKASAKRARPGRRIALPKAELPIERLVHSLEVWLPVPPAVLSPNARAHWATKAREIKAYRRLAADEAALARRNAGMTGRWIRAQLTIRAYVLQPARWDRDNLVARLKAGIDGLADAGIVANDRDFRIGEVDIFPGSRETVGVELTIDDLDP